MKAKLDKPTACAIKIKRLVCAHKLTKVAGFDSIMPLQPKAGLPAKGAGCGGTNYRGIGWGERLAATPAKATFKAKPVS